MTQIKTISFIIILIVCTGFISASSGFSSVSAERGVSVQVVSDERAYIDYESTDLTVHNGETVDLVTIENRFSESVSVVDITQKSGTFTISEITKPDKIHPGENKIIRGTVECTPNETQKIGLTVTLKGSGVTAQIFGDTETRDFTLTCAAPQ
jgi:hypothetical protein